MDQTDELPMDYRAGCPRLGCPCRRPGAVCPTFMGCDGDQFCPRCGWAKHRHVTDEQRAIVLNAAAAKLDAQAKAHQEGIHDYTDLLRVWADDPVRWDGGD